MEPILHFAMIAPLWFSTCWKGLLVCWRSMTHLVQLSWKNSQKCCDSGIKVTLRGFRGLRPPETLLPYTVSQVINLITVFFVSPSFFLSLDLSKRKGFIPCSWISSLHHNPTHPPKTSLPSPPCRACRARDLKQRHAHRLSPFSCRSVCGLTSQTPVV